ncbi:MAG: hypothetical protein K0Q59_1983 [Paenibacillus sp.]|jgi:glycerophosphoryl diester phosphodiesterase|nr:hypothetical protein [Paenibacillus sp.]
MFGKPEYSSINRLLNDKIDRHRVLIAVHRGSSGGNIIENTIPAYKTAIQLGGDLIEADVVKSTDGVFYTFHDGQEKKLFHEPDNIKTMDSAKIDSLCYFNSNYLKNTYKAERLGDVLSFAEGKDILINIDRAWGIWPELLSFLDKYEVIQQILLKSPVKQELLEFLNAYPQKYMFMPIVRSEADIETVLNYPHINLVGMELIANSETHPLFQDELIDKLHSMNVFVWANAINLDDNYVLYAHLDDDTSILAHPDQGWGRLFAKKIDIIQTDWPSLLFHYRQKSF